MPFALAFMLSPRWSVRPSDTRITGRQRDAATGTAAAVAGARAGGFWLMRFVNVTPRVQSALRAAPLAEVAAGRWLF